MPVVLNPKTPAAMFEEAVTHAMRQDVSHTHLLFHCLCGINNASPSHSVKRHKVGNADKFDCASTLREFRCGQKLCFVSRIGGKKCSWKRQLRFKMTGGHVTTHGRC